MNKRVWTKLVSCLLTGLLMLSSCETEPEGTVFVINEVNASNKTGLMAEDGETHDWIEIKNISEKEYSLRGYSLAKDSGMVTWQFPDTVLGPNECMLVFATKKELKKQLSCGFKISGKGECLQLITRSGRVMSEASYKKLKGDQVLKYTKKEKYKKTYKQTPGFENDKDGYQQYLELIESQRKDPLKIWEYMTKVPGGDKNIRWIEIKNTSNAPVKLNDYALTNDMDEPDLMTLPEQELAPGAFFLVADKDKKLSSQVLILTKKKKFVDAVNAHKTYLGVSIGRKNGSKGFFYYNEPTPNAENTTKAFEDITDEPEFNHHPGAYDKKKIYLKFKNKDAKVYYTLDGSLPTRSSKVFKDSILIEKNTIVRAFVEDSVNLASPVTTSTFIVGTKHKLPIVSLVINNEDLYDYHTGIYVAGPGASADFPHVGANYWKKWEKKAHIEFIEGKDGFSTDCGLKIFGGYSRALDKKSFHIKLHGRYGRSKVDYDMYNRGKKDDVKSFVLRSGSQDYTGVMARDEFFTSLMAQNSPNLYVQAYRPVVVYLNAEYWGIYYVREKINREYVAKHLNVDPSTANLLMAQHGALVGNSTEYINLCKYATSHNMKVDSVFKYMEDHVDFESLIDEKIGQFYSNNTDVGNIRYFKSTDPKCDGKWHWIYYDLDATFECIKPLSYYVEGSTLFAEASSVGPYNVLPCQLLKNPKFRQLFIERWAYHMKNTFEPEHALKVFDGIINTIDPEMERECQRWPQMSYTSWKKNCERFREKIRNRPSMLQPEFIKGLNITQEEQKKYLSDIKINSTDANNSKNNGKKK